METGHALVCVHWVTGRRHSRRLSDVGARKLGLGCMARAGALPSTASTMAAPTIQAQAIPTYTELLAQQAASRLAFGRMLLNWRRHNGWSQYTAFNWAEAIGEPKLVISYGNLSVIEQGKAGELRQRAFWQLWELNRRIADRDWGRFGDGELRQKLETAIPLGDAECPVWGPLEFWACYSGLRPVPEAFAVSPAPVIGPRQATLLSNRWRQQLRSLIESHQLDPATALDALMALAGEVPQGLLCRAHRLSHVQPPGAQRPVAPWRSLPARAVVGAMAQLVASCRCCNGRSSLSCESR
jgi:hypothetical protein